MNRSSAEKLSVHVIWVSINQLLTTLRIFFKSAVGEEAIEVTLYCMKPIFYKRKSL